MYAAMLLNVAGIPFGAGAVSSALGGWIIVGALLVCTIILTACFDRSPRLTSPDHNRRWVATSRMEQGFWGFRIHCAEAVARDF
jgi:hypothetical protein